MAASYGWIRRRSKIRPVYIGKLDGEEVAFAPLCDGRGTAIVDVADVELIDKFNWSLRRGYAKTSVSGTIKTMHGVVFAAMGFTGRPDHKNRNRLDNRRQNLRPCTNAQNTQNRSKFRGTSQFKGVTFDRSRNRWRAQISASGQTVYIGKFKEELPAAIAYDAAAVKYHGEFAVLNFPTEATDAR